MSVATVIRTGDGYFRTFWSPSRSQVVGRFDASADMANVFDSEESASACLHELAGDLDRLGLSARVEPWKVQS